MERKLFLVINPCSGTGRIRQKLFEVVNTLSAGGYTVTVFPTKCRGDATRATKELDDSFETVVCCGGDGTLNEVITGLMANKNRYKLGYIPSGTLNEWSGGLKISRNFTTAAKDVVADCLIPLDIGRFDDRYFSYTASFGAFTDASYSAPQDVKNVLGQAAYFFEGIKALSNIHPIPMQLTVDGKDIRGEFLFGSISNSMSVGGVVHFDQTTVQLNDGLFEILLIRNPANLLELNDILDGLVKKDLHRKSIEYLHGKTVEIFGCDNLSWTLDGEYAAGKSYIKIENIHSAMQFLVPQKSAHLHSNK